MKILFIGNSHTFFNDMPHIFEEIAGKNGVACTTVMLAHGGWTLDQHIQSPDVGFNIRYGHYDYVVLQEHAHPFGPVEEVVKNIRKLKQMVCEAGSVPVVYMTWAPKDKPEQQAEITEVYEKLAAEMNLLLAPVGKKWYEHIAEHPDVELFFMDGAHASPAGSHLIAEVIWNTIDSHRGSASKMD